MTATYPSSLPAPATYSVVPAQQLAITSDDGLGPMQFRRRTRNTGAIAQITFRYFKDQYKVFHEWWVTELLYGHKWFTINLPGAGGVVPHVVRFTTKYVADHQGYRHTDVSANIEILARQFMAPLPFIQLPAFIGYQQLDSSGYTGIPPHAAGDRMIQIMYGTDVSTAGPAPGSPGEPAGWSTVFFEAEDSVSQALRGMRVAQKVDVDNSETAVGEGSFPQKAVLVTRYGEVGAFATTPIAVSANATLPEISTPPGSLVLWGIQSNKFSIFNVPIELGVLGDSRTPFLLGPTWINGLCTANAYQAADKLILGSEGAYLRTWAVVLYPDGL